MVYRMLTSVAIWVAASLMVISGKLRDRDLGYVLVASTVSTIAVWALQPSGSPTARQ